MNPNKSQTPEICAEIRDYIDGTLRADVYLAVKWDRFVGYYLSGYGEDVVKACLPHLGVELRGDVVFLWAGEYYRRLVEAVASLTRQEGNVSIVADLYEEEAP
jgi:hypothetical protein